MASEIFEGDMSNIIEIQTKIQKTPLKKVFRTALRETRLLQEVIVEIRTDSDLVGQGAACSTEKVTGEILEGIRQVIQEFIFPAIRGKSLGSYEQIFTAIDTSVVANYAAKAAVDMAVYDLIAQQQKKLLVNVLGGYREEIHTDLTLSLDTPENMAQEAVNAVAEGFQILKMKVGTTVDDDIKRVHAVREAIGDNIRLRLDANQAWKPRQAVKIFHLLEKYQPELIEQPVIASDLEGLRWIRSRVGLPLMADESLMSPKDALRLVQLEAVDYFNIKLLKCGGIHKALEILAIAEAAGIECMLGCMLEGPISVSHAIHLAMAKKMITSVDLDSLFFLEEEFNLAEISYGPKIVLKQ